MPIEHRRVAIGSWDNPWMARDPTFWTSMSWAYLHRRQGCKPHIWRNHSLFVIKPRPHLIWITSMSEFNHKKWWRTPDVQRHWHTLSPEADGSVDSKPMVPRGVCVYKHPLNSLECVMHVYARCNASTSLTCNFIFPRFWLFRTSTAFR